MPAAPVLLTFVQYLIAFCSRPEVAGAGNVISGKAVDSVGMGIRAKFGDSRLKCGLIIRFNFSSLTHCCAVSNCILQETGNN